MTDNEALALTVIRQEMARLRGKLCGAIEAVGMPERQERAAKILVKDIAGDIQRHSESALRGEYKGDGTSP